MNSYNPLAIIARRRSNFNLLHSRLARVSPLPFTSLPPGACPLFYPIVVPDKVRFRMKLSAHNIGSVNLWSQPHPRHPEAETEQTARWRRSILELPIHQQLDSEDIERIAKTVSILLSEKPAVITKMPQRREVVSS
jgi:perosamine synthetase